MGAKSFLSKEIMSVSPLKGKNPKLYSARSKLFWINYHYWLTSSQRLQPKTNERDMVTLQGPGYNGPKNRVFLGILPKMRGHSLIWEWGQFWSNDIRWTGLRVGTLVKDRLNFTRKASALDLCEISKIWCFVSGYIVSMEFRVDDNVFLVSATYLVQENRV